MFCQQSLQIVLHNNFSLIYTSHHLTEAESLCTKVALIDEGKIIVQNDLQTLLAEHKQDGLEGLFISLTGRSYRDH